ncbi:MAG: pseudoazurin [Pseudomonadota bacterium]
MSNQVQESSVKLLRTALFGASALALVAACGGADAEESDNESVFSEVSEAIEETAAAVEETTADVAEAAETAAADVQDAASDAMDKAEDAASDMMDKAEDAASDMMEKAEDVAEDVQDEASATMEAAEEAVADAEAAGPVVHEIQMLNSDPEKRSERMVFRPDLVVAKPGDTIRFIPTDPSHQSSSIDAMLPEGVEGWKGKVNAVTDYVVTEPGVYGYKCVPHYAGGMVGLVIVEGDGMTSNVAAAKKERQIGLAKRRFDNLWERAGDYINE